MRSEGPDNDDQQSPGITHHVQPRASDGTLTVPDLSRYTHKAKKPTEVPLMTSDLRSLDLHTINAASEAAAAAVREQALQWEMQSASAAFCGQLNEALTCEHWAFAANIIASTVSSELTGLFVQALAAKMVEPIPAALSVGEGG
jgi:hypothetical protein